MIRVLHIGSFQGNIGDRLNHLGFRPWFERIVNDRVQWTELEIRRWYRREIDFREAVTELSRDVDLIIAGGGGFWELWPENTETGTSLDFSYEFLERLGKPVFFNALGVDSGQGIGSRARESFAEFLEALVSDDSFLVSVRNDGSTETLRNFFGGLVPSGIFEIPDHGFFAALELGLGSDVPKRNALVLSIAVDMPHLRFRRGLTADMFLGSFARAIESISDKFGLEIVLVPHIYSDLAGIAELLSLLPDSVRRESVRVAALETTSFSGVGFIHEYMASRMVASMRFHGNVMGISSRAPTIGLDSYPKVRALIRGLPPECVNMLEINQADFSERFTNKVENMFLLENSKVSQYFDAVNSNLLEERSRFGSDLADWLGRTI